MYMFMHQQQNNCTISIRMHYQFECKKDHKIKVNNCFKYILKEIFMYICTYIYDFKILSQTTVQFCLITQKL